MEVWSPAKLIGWKQIWFGPFEWSDENNFLRIVIYKCGQIWKTCIIANNIVTFNHPCSLRTVKGLEFLQSFLFDKETPQRFHLDLFSDTISIYNLTPTHWTENPGYLKSHPFQPKKKDCCSRIQEFYGFKLKRETKCFLYFEEHMYNCTIIVHRSKCHPHCHFARRPEPEN